MGHQLQSWQSSIISFSRHLNWRKESRFCASCRICQNSHPFLNFGHFWVAAHIYYYLVTCHFLLMDGSDSLQTTQVRNQQHFQSSLSLKNAHSLSSFVIQQLSGGATRLCYIVPCVSTNLDAFGDWIEVE